MWLRILPPPPVPSQSVVRIATLVGVWRASLCASADGPSSPGDRLSHGVCTTRARSRTRVRREQAAASEILRRVPIRADRCARCGTREPPARSGLMVGGLDHATPGHNSPRGAQRQSDRNRAARCVMMWWRCASATCDLASRILTSSINCALARRHALWQRFSDALLAMSLLEWLLVVHRCR